VKDSTQPARRSAHQGQAGSGSGRCVAWGTSSTLKAKANSPGAGKPRGQKTTAARLPLAGLCPGCPHQRSGHPLLDLRQAPIQQRRRPLPPHSLSPSPHLPGPALRQAGNSPLAPYGTILNSFEMLCSGGT
jgi:hypothetical protein